MILVDSSVWIDYFNGKISPCTDKLDRLLRSEPLAIGDLILTEVLQGFSADREFDKAEDVLTSLHMVDLCGSDIALSAAKRYRKLRKMGVTVRKTIDCIIATKCIEGGFDLLHNDRDFDPFEKYFGLFSVSHS